MKIKNIILTLLCMLMLLAPVSAFAGICEDSLSDWGFTCPGDEEGISSFAEYKGTGIEVPTGYTEELTQAGDVREFTVKVVNFALGFLGLVAIIIVIYGGALYLTAAGDTEKSGKGSKTIMYAVIGIIIILGSYAIVNTVLQAPGGEVTGGEMGAAEEATEEIEIYKYNIAAIDIEKIAIEYITAYDNFQEIQTALLKLETLPPPGSTEEVMNFLYEIKPFFESIANQTELLSYTHMAVEDAINNYVDRYLILSESELGEVLGTNKFETVEDVPGDWGKPMEEFLNTFWDNGHKYFYDQVEGAATERQGFTQYLESVGHASYRDYNEDIDVFKDDLGEIYLEIQDIAEASEETTGQLSINQQFIEILGCLPGTGACTGTGYFDQVKIPDSAKIPQLDFPTLDQVKTLMDGLSKLYEAVKDIQFVYAKIDADTIEGNADLIVNFEALGSRDPAGVTIPDNNFEWEFGGKQGETSRGGLSECEGKGPIATCTYIEPGSYIVTLKVKSSDEELIAPGTAKKTITVHPHPSEVHLKINNDDIVKYDINHNVIIKKTDYQILESEALNGIQFDASQSLGSDKTDIPTDGYIWDFGDNTDIESGPQVSHTYSSKGDYKVTLTVTDRRGISDKIIVNVHVGSPTAQIRASQTSGNIDTEFVFDSSGSKSDAGEIVEQDWQATKIDVSPSENVEIGERKNKLVTVKFSKPGDYELRLDVIDQDNERATATQDVIVVSKPPEAYFSYETPDENEPSKVYLDGSKSIDPDTGTNENLTYTWDIGGAILNTDYKVVEGTLQGTETQGASKPVVKFLKKGDYQIKLFVEDETTTKSQDFTQEIKINSVLDISFTGEDADATIVKQLSEITDSVTGEIITTAEVTLDVVSEAPNIAGFEWDFGDGTDIETTSSNVKTSTHTYTEAGNFTAKVTVFDEEDNENTISKRIFIGGLDEPIAAISLTINGKSVYKVDEIVAYRDDKIEFDAGNSLNSDGVTRGLEYNWDFGDGERSTERKITHKYNSLGEYNVSLTAREKDDPAKISKEDTLKITIENATPTLTGLEAVITGTSNITPVPVQLKARGVNDPDGNVIQYKWWYFEEGSPENPLGIQITQTDIANLTIDTRGQSGEEKIYQFAVELTDNEYNRAISTDILPPAILPKLTVKNAEVAPVKADFDVSKTQIKVNEEVKFSSTSEGEIKEYCWDLEGDGFADNKCSDQATIRHTFTEPNLEGVLIKLKVVDIYGNASESDGVRIYVEVEPEKVQPVKAAFITEINDKNVKFINNSKADETVGVEIISTQWDFDISYDSDGDGIANNDIDSTEFAPENSYASYKIYSVKLTVEDNAGNEKTVTNSVNIVKPVEEELDARLKTDPEPNPQDNKVHLKGASGEVTFHFYESKGDIKTYEIDKNIYFDGDGNGIRDDDIDFRTEAPGSWTTGFEKVWGKTVVKLTVTGRSGEKDSVTKEIVFDAENNLGANLFTDLDKTTLSYILGTILFFIFIGTVIYYNQREY